MLFVPSGRPPMPPTLWPGLGPNLFAIAGAPTHPDRPSRRCAYVSVVHPTDEPKSSGGPPRSPVGPSLDRLLEIALEVRRAGDKPGVRGRGGPALAELRFLGVVGTKL
jgi:hypothetical protein